MNARAGQGRMVAEGTLAGVGAGARVRVTGLLGGAGLQARLIGMGIRPGVEVEVRRNDGRGPVVVALGRTRVALGRGMASQIRAE